MDQGVPGPAVRTCDEGVAEAPIGLIFQFPAACRTNCGVRRYARAGWAALLRPNNLEDRIAGWRDLLSVQLIQTSQWGHREGEVAGEGTNGGFFAFDLDRGPSGVVPDLARQAGLSCQAVYGWPETNTLDCASAAKAKTQNQEVMERLFSRRAPRYWTQALTPSPVVDATSKMVPEGLRAARCSRTAFISKGT